MKTWCDARPVDLLAQLADEDVDGAVAPRLAAAPEPLHQLVARDDAAALARERVEEAELGRRQLGALAVDERLHDGRVDAQLLDLDRVAARDLLGADAAPGGDANAGDELLHGEGLHEVVVGPELERVHAVVLAAARADDDDRRADPLVAHRLDQLPAVEAGQHQVEHADVRLLEAQACECEVAAVDADGVEAGGLDVPRDRLRDDGVVLDDEHLRHPGHPDARATRAGVPRW